MMVMIPVIVMMLGMLSGDAMVKVDNDDNGENGYVSDHDK